MNKSLKEKISALPNEPGVYFYKDSTGRIIYIGKANDLKKRVQSYFSRYLDAKTQALVSRIADIEHKITASPVQAQILEAALIKQHQPQYNIDLKDDKSFPLIKITQEAYPLVAICRQKTALKDNAHYFGPYTNAVLLRQAFKLMRQIFGFRSCKTMPDKVCLYFRLKLCPGPCEAKISVEEYNRNIEAIKLFLGSRYEELIAKLSARMQQFARGQCFEQAARLRDQINALAALEAHGISAADALAGLKELVGLKCVPLRIEGFDISNISGQQATGSMVSFFKGRPDKNNYRRFKIKTVGRIDDYAMIREVVKRRYSRLSRENRKMPDLVLIDGGRQHLLAAQQELDKLGLDIPIISIAKDQENLYIKGKASPVRMPFDNAALNLIRRVRDQAHRFARKYHHLLRKKQVFKNE